MVYSPGDAQGLAAAYRQLHSGHGVAGRVGRRRLSHPLLHRRVPRGGSGRLDSRQQPRPADGEGAHDRQPGARHPLLPQGHLAQQRRLQGRHLQLHHAHAGRRSVHTFIQYVTEHQIVFISPTKTFYFNF